MKLMQIIGLLAIVFAFTHASDDKNKVNVGDVVSDFALTDLNGKLVKLSDFKGKVVVLEWTNPNCPFVQRVYREKIMTSVQKEFTQKGVVWIIINSTNPKHRDYREPKELKKIYDEWSATYTAYLMDPDGKVGKMFDAKTTPHMFIINKDGKLVYAGAIDDDPRGEKKEKVNYVKNALDEILSGKPVSVSITKPYGCSVKYSE
ncbi:Peroxiredoxin [Candidatus Kryptonium thompsonii]|uniref:Peroxiredoxin n=2 Tax=Candidatus Kryptonium thompsonii TaxID=1633631 RepID=A0A0P1LWU1_9BACT|nr:thioredoxin family protein [Candidatus Kryptonium thompsoni]CUS77679.1 Peroxiredoxin [Candidatus Kryptonium thompsoni]CUS81683.1 Peroxiredoxin [Candidatus Kryptonium thompsoni]CUS86369.1 Peroxiredoxin [Candidatus Kryptonium thompsoni]CUS92199.1 Peroxiredoxin [Candidatus Kryptonium thompsoni]CUT05061.1 Peroxiredoxin [Candidatus Kryptonium thompsoni]